jgi:hypothetical protein
MRGFAIVLLVSVVVVLPQRASAVSVNLGTNNAANWLTTVGGGGGGTPFLLNIVPGWPTGIGITSNGTASGQWVPGASAAAFNGFWAARETFTIPEGATNVSLSFSGLGADDRCVLELNGTILGDYNLSQQTGPGIMSFPPGLPDVPYNYTLVTNGQITSGFLSGENELLLVVNNTGWGGPHDPTRAMPEGDNTFVSLNATLTYTVPEPSTLALIGIGTITALAYTWRRQRTS